MAPQIDATPQGRRFLISRLSKQQLAQYLRDQGYTITDRNLNRARQHYIVSWRGKPSVGKFNAQWGMPTGLKSRPAPTRVMTVVGSNKPKKPKGSRLPAAPAAPSFSPVAAPQIADLFKGINPKTGKPFKAKKLAEKLAAAQFDAAIAELEAEQSKLPGQRAQNLHDIENWYGQVLAQDAKNIAAAGAARQSASAQQAGAAEGFIQAAGGNEGAAALVGGQAAANQGLLQAVGLSHEDLAGTLMGLTGAEQAASLKNEARYMDEVGQSLLRDIAKMKSDKGAAYLETFIRLRDMNNQLAQQTFGNRMSLAGARTDVMGQNASLGLQTAEYNNSLQQQAFDNAMTAFSTSMGLRDAKLDRKIKQTELALRRQELNGSGPTQQPKWIDYSPQDKLGLTNSVAQSFLVGRQQKPDPRVKTKAQLKAWVKQRLVQTAGINNPAAVEMALRAIRQLVPGWFEQLR